MLKSACSCGIAAKGTTFSLKNFNELNPKMLCMNDKCPKEVLYLKTLKNALKRFFSYTYARNLIGPNIDRGHCTAQISNLIYVALTSVPSKITPKMYSKI